MLSGPKLSQAFKLSRVSLSTTLRDLRRYCTMKILRAWNQRALWMLNSKWGHRPTKKVSGSRETSQRRNPKGKGLLREGPISLGRINRLRASAIEHGRISGAIAMQAEAETSRTRGISTVSTQCIMIRWWGSTMANSTLKIRLRCRILTRTTIGNHNNLSITSIILKFFLLSSRSNSSKILSPSRFHPSTQFSRSKGYLDSIRPLKTLKTRKAFSEAPALCTIIESSEELEWAL